MTKPIFEWTEADLQALKTEQVQESLTLDYKASASLDKTKQAKILEMSKDVAAFANSAGGRIVYGIVEQGHLPVEIDGGVTDPTITHEWIEQKLLSTIRPRIQGLIIRQIDLASGGRAFVIDIPAATSFAPHMSEDNKYYRRFNFQSVPMEDYEVKDAMRRALAPDLFAQFGFEAPVADGAEFKVSASVVVSNNSIEPALYSSINLVIENRLQPSQIAQWTFQLGEVALGGLRVPATIYRRNFIVPSHQPLWQGKMWGVGSVDLVMKAGEYYTLGWQMEWPGGFSQNWTMITLDGDRLAVEDVTPRPET